MFSILAFIVKLAFPSEVSRQTGLSAREIVHSFIYPYDNPLRELWFIATLFWFFLLTPLWKWALEKKWTMWVVMVALLFSHFAYPSIELLCIGRVFSYAIWFYFGLVISKEEYVDRYLIKQPWLVVIIGIAISVCGRLTEPFIATLGGTVFSFGFALIADKYLPKLFFSFRNYTYQIFLMGIFAQIIVKIIYRHIEAPYFLTYLFCIIAGLYVPVLVSKFLEWANCKPLLLSVGLKYR